MLLIEDEALPRYRVQESGANAPAQTPLSAHSSSMILSENRYPLFGIMLLP
jgi:hypothetical protein